MASPIKNDVEINEPITAEKYYIPSIDLIHTTYDMLIVPMPILVSFQIYWLCYSDISPQ